MKTSAEDSDRRIRFDPSALDQSIARRFEQQVALYPHQLAIKTDGAALDYAGLNGLANQIAAEFLQNSPDAMRPVALRCAGHLAAVAAQLAALKGGVPFIVLDTSWPEARCHEVIADAGVQLLLTDVAPLRGLKVPVLHVDQDHAAGGFDNPNIDVPPEAIAYILYTSGSTGRPSAVMQDHRAVLHNVMKYTNAFQISQQDRCTSLFSYSFGEAMNNVLYTLLNGATLMPNVPQHADGAQLATWLSQERVTIFHAVPSLFRELAPAVTPDIDLSGLRYVNLSGEPLSKEDVERFQKKFPKHITLVNSYGSTETKLISQHFMRHDTELEGDTAPVGYAAQDVIVEIRDDAGHVAPSGDVGEIVVRSAYLASGYWGDSERTRARFITDDETPLVCYYTGDLGFMGDDGLITRTGRSDAMLKVRGYRIEPEEVERVLLTTGEVKEAAVVADPDDANRLVAYVVPKQETLDHSQLRQLLSDRLPPYMMPNLFIPLAEMPRTTSGKVDRRHLPRREAVPSWQGSRETVPGTASEQKLANLWKSLLGVDQVAIEDDFFLLGGHSLLVAELHATIKKKLGVDVPLPQLVDVSTLGGQLAVIDRYRQSSITGILVPLGDTRGTPLYCIHTRGSYLYYYENLLPHLDERVALYGLRERGLDGDRKTHVRIRDMAYCYVDEIRAHQPKGPYHICGYSFGGLVAHEMANILHDMGESISFLGIVDTYEPSTLRQFQCATQPPPGKSRWSELWRKGSEKRGMEKVAYAWSSLGNVWRRNVYRLKKALWLTAYRYYIRRNKLMPRRIRDAVRADCYRQMEQDFNPDAFPGELTVFRSMQRDRDAGIPRTMGWEKYVSGRIEVVDVSGEHENVLREPHVSRLAEALIAQVGRGARNV